MPTKTKNGKTKLEIRNWQEAESAMLAYREALVREQRANVALDEALTKVQERCQPELQDAENAVAGLLDALKKFAQSKKSEFKPAPNGDGRSYAHAGVTLGFRQSPGRVEIRKEEEAVEWLRDFRRGELVRTIHEPNRELLLEVLRRGVDQRLVETLAAHGIRYEQKDKFFLEVEKES